jgi:hypothetical protein
MDDPITNRIVERELSSDLPSGQHAVVMTEIYVGIEPRPREASVLDAPDHPRLTTQKVPDLSIN